jgi:1,4-alpha-glucan branching enzyme
MAAITVITTSCVADKPVRLSPETTPAGVHFRFVDRDARSVTVAGSFNDWSTSSHPLSRVLTSAIWEVVVPLAPGEHLFMFVVDGTQWITPPDADDFVDDGFGSRNGVVIVPPKER